MVTLLKADGYKLSHIHQYPDGIRKVYSNWTPRKSRIEGITHIVNFGVSYVFKKLIDDFNENFFSKPKDEVVSEYQREVESYLGTKYDVKHIEELHDLGYLPIKVKALPEGTLVPIRTPMFTIVNTKPEFFWLTNYLETILSSLLWQPMTSATIAKHYRDIFDKWAEKTAGDFDIIPGVLKFTDLQGHDFSMRGMEAFESSGMGHLTSFKGTDTIPAVIALKKYYPASQNTIYGTSVPATEHSVMCAGGDGEGEFETFKRLITEIYPSGVVSIVSDTWDLWKVLTDYLPRLKDEIMARDGKVVIRPDSGDPVHILCGYSGIFGDKYVDPATPEGKGVVELLWDVFGGTVNEKGYKMLDPHIGCIYGDSITPDRADEICSRLEKKGFASTNWIAGIGSFTYQYNTRDTFGFAMKATYVEFDDGTKEEFDPEQNEIRRTHSIKGKFIYKEPVTDSGMKKSARGLVRVNEDLSYDDRVSWADEREGMLEEIIVNGKFVTEIPGIDVIRERIRTGVVENQYV